jgi:hypothetical protein
MGNSRKYVMRQGAGANTLYFVRHGENRATLT